MNLVLKNFRFFQTKFIYSYLCLFTGFLLSELSADVKLPKGLGPVALDSSYSVVKGASIEITLAATSQQSGQVFEYSIFEKPKYGKLLTIDNKTITQGEVLGTGKIIRLRYFAEFIENIDEDIFTYRARTQGGKYSSPSKVKVLIAKEPIKISIQDEINFGDLQIGFKGSKDLIVINQSKEDIDISLSELKKYSYLNNASRLNVPAKGRIVIPVHLNQSNRIGPIGEELIVQVGEIQRKVKLMANITPPFSIVTSPVLKFKFVDGQRTAKLNIKNNYNEDISLNISHEGSSFLYYESDVNIEQKSNFELPLYIKKDYQGDVKLVINIRHDKFTSAIDLEAEALPANVEINNSTKSIKIVAKVGDVINTNIPLKNTGGRDVDLKIVTSKGLKFNQNQKDLIRLTPNDDQFLKLSYIAKSPGKIIETVGFNWPNGNKTIQIIYDIESVNDSEAVKKNNTAKVVKQNIIIDPNTIIPVVEEERDVNKDLPAIKTIALIKRGKRSLKISWDNTYEKDLNYVVETRVHRLDKSDQVLKFHWIELNEEYSQIKKNESGGEAIISGLAPGGRYTFRVLSKDNDGKFSVPSKLVQFTTKNQFVFTNRLLINGSGILGGLFLVFYFCIRIFRERFG